MRKFKDKVKKKRLIWNEVIIQLHDNEVWRRYLVFKTEHPSMSSNRCAYNVLKSYYSTTALRQAKKDFNEFGYALVVLHLRQRVCPVNTQF